MFQDYKVIEVTKENEGKYLNGIVELEELVLKKMEAEGKVGQLFTTGEEGLREYIHSKNNHILAAIKNDGSNQVISAAYITRGQTRFTYNDITKYFKCGKEYDEYVKNTYSSKNLYCREMVDTYLHKLQAYCCARDILLGEYKIYPGHTLNEEKSNELFLQMVQNEYNDSNNGFHEKSELREKFNRYMTRYMESKHPIDKRNYEYFYWLDFKTLLNNVPEKSRKQTEDLFEYFSQKSSAIAYDKVLEFQKYKIYDKSHCENISKYYDANPKNTIELDTYITHPDYRKNGIAEILTFEGIKKALDETDKNDNKIYLVSTLHEDNFASKYVSEFFGLKDYLFVNRRNGRDRQVHIYGMDRKDIPEYIKSVDKKLNELYNYKPKNIIEHEL